jgi:uncharacterized protein (TIGR03437 family)
MDISLAPPETRGLKPLILAAILAYAPTLIRAAFAQDAPTILQVDVENFVNYAYDVSDLSKLAQNPGPLVAAQPVNFSTWVTIADVTAINGSPAKGTLVMSTQFVRLTPAPTPGMAIADIVRTGYVHWAFELLKPDGSPIGSIFVAGLSGGTPPPGSPLNASAGNNAIFGGTGAFTGARGSVNAVAPSSGRSASQVEDPSMRRINGGGKSHYVLQIIPMSRPEVVTTATGPLVLHADWTPVTADKPAQRGEVLIAIARGLGPTLPGVNPGDPFPRDPFAVVTSPVDVIVDGSPRLQSIKSDCRGQATCITSVSAYPTRRLLGRCRCKSVRHGSRGRL